MSLPAVNIVSPLSRVGKTHIWQSGEWKEANHLPRHRVGKVLTARSVKGLTLIDCREDSSMGPSKTKKQDLSYFHVGEISPAPENNLIYDRFSPGTDKDDRDLLISIAQTGVRDPLHITCDRVIVSGHRRHAAARLLRLGRVPAIVHQEYCWAEMSRDERLMVLADYNNQRDKSFTEKVRENLITIDTDDAYHALVIDRKQRCRVVESNIKMRPRVKRKKITTMDFLKAVQRVLQTERAYWPLTVRRVHYLLLNNPPLRHDRKDGRYSNNQSHYKALTDLLIRARLARLVPMEAIIDETRPMNIVRTHQNPADFIRQETEDYLKYYNRDLLRGQQNHIEVLCEKDGLGRHVAEVASQYCITTTVGRGFASATPRWEMAKRYWNSKKANLVLLILSDFDPEGEVIAETFPRSMRDDFDIDNIVPLKVAISAADVEQYNLPSDMDAKTTSTNYRRFVEAHGTKVAELDAAPIDLLQRKLREAIEGSLDMDAFRVEQEQERKDAAEIRAMKKAIVEFIGKKDIG